MQLHLLHHNALAHVVAVLSEMLARTRDPVLEGI